MSGRRCVVARIIVMADAKHLREGIEGTILYAEQVAPEHLDDLRCSEQILERLEGAVRGERVAVWDMLPTAREVARMRQRSPGPKVPHGA
jgi:hypothetical protein